MRLTVGQRALLAFVFMVLLVFVASGTGILYSRAVEDTVDATQNGLDASNRIAHLEVDWLFLAATIDKMLLTRQISLAEEARLQMADFNGEMTDLRSESIGSTEALTAENQVILDRLESLRADLDTVVADLLTAAQEGRWATAQVLRHTDMDSLQRRFDEQFALIVENVQSDVDQSVANAEDARNTSRAYLLLTAVVAVVAGVMAGYLTLTGVTGPIRAMARTAAAIRAGDLSQRADASVPGELGELAVAFNDMAIQVQSMVGSLEQRVAARTRDLRIAAQVSEQVVTILDVDQLLPRVVELTKASFNLYHAHVYLLDEDNQRLNLAAGAGDAGRAMKQRGHRIPLSARSLVGKAARDNLPVVIDDVTQAPDFLPHPLLPDTRSEASFPLAAGGRVFGVLDVQSDQIGRFDAEFQTVLATLSGQIAVAIQNAYLFREVERASRHERALSAITQEIQRATNVEEVLQVAARELGKALRAPHTAIELQVRPEATARIEDEGVAVDLEPPVAV
jgi:GAF domain-containing protein/HAMP domain-containing protein